MSTAFTQTIDWLAFTLPHAARSEVIAQLGGEWVKMGSGFLGYPLGFIWMDGQGGVGKMGTGAPRRPHEIHVDLSGGIVNQWPMDRVKAVLLWILNQGGHITRLDIALDDRAASVSTTQVKAAVEQGYAVTRADRMRVICETGIRDGAPRGETLYFGSPQSQTQLRVYDKRAGLTQKGRPEASAYGTRWELQLKQARAQTCAKALCYLAPDDWKAFLVGVLRAYIDFRQITREATPWEKYRAPLLDWWAALTEGFRRCRLLVAKAQKTLEDVKHWFSRSIGPLFAVLYVKAGERFLEGVLVAGIQRWTTRHTSLMQAQQQPPKGTPYVLQPA